MNRGPDASHPPHEPAERRLGEQKRIETAGPHGPQDPPLIRRCLSHTPVALREDSTIQVGIILLVHQKNRAAAVGWLLLLIQADEERVIVGFGKGRELSDNAAGLMLAVE